LPCSSQPVAPPADNQQRQGNSSALGQAQAQPDWTVFRHRTDALNARPSLPLAPSPTRFIARSPGSRGTLQSPQSLHYARLSDNGQRPPRQSSAPVRLYDRFPANSLQRTPVFTTRNATAKEHYGETVSTGVEGRLPRTFRSAV
jgi:hypothetical protein